jgi:hypothetical protein
VALGQHWHFVGACHLKNAFLETLLLRGQAGSRVKKRGLSAEYQFTKAE